MIHGPLELTLGFNKHILLRAGIWVKTFFILILAFYTTAIYAMPVHFHCQTTPQQTENVTDCDHAETSSDSAQNSQHDCPMHHLGCTHHTGLLMSSSKSFVLDLHDSQAFSAFVSHMKPGPVLDGPFQPPRI